MTTDPEALIERAAARFKYEHRNACYPDATDFEATQAAEQIIEEALRDLTAENARLKARLELDPEWGEQADGIACRNDTIKLLDERIARQDERLTRQLTASQASCEYLAKEADRLLVENVRLKALGDGLAATARLVRQGIRALGVKREPALYEAVMAFDAALAAWETRDEA